MEMRLSRITRRQNWVNFSFTILRRTVTCE